MLSAPESATKATELSPVPTLIGDRAVQPLSAVRRYVLLLIFCLAQFMDVFNNSAVLSAIPELTAYFNMTPAEATWVVSTLQLTFASFLLISGRLSDVYNPKIVFICGLSSLGAISLGTGFVNDKIALLVLRATGGICASMTIPSALTLIVNVFPDPHEQARAIGVFGGVGAIANAAGLVIGAILVEYASWRWVFWFVSLVAIPVAGVCVIVVPHQEPKMTGVGEHRQARWKILDLGGVAILTAALILFIFAVTSGTSAGWSSAMVLAPLVISVFMVVAFFLYEKAIPADRAALPPSTWFLPNFAVLFGSALYPYFWWTTVLAVYTNFWQNVYGWSAIETAVRMIPVGVLAAASSTTGPLSRRISPKWLILTGQTLCMASCILFAFADGPDRYWPLVFPGFFIGSAGAMLIFTHTNVAIFRTSPPSMAGTVGAVFNGAVQLGSAVGISAVSSIQSSIEQRRGRTSYAGVSAGFWFLFAFTAVEALAMLAFYRSSPAAPEPGGSEASSLSVASDTEKGEKGGMEPGPVAIGEKIADPRVSVEVSEARPA